MHEFDDILGRGHIKPSIEFSDQVIQQWNCQVKAVVPCAIWCWNVLMMMLPSTCKVWGGLLSVNTLGYLGSLGVNVGMK